MENTFMKKRYRDNNKPYPSYKNKRKRYSRSSRYSSEKNYECYNISSREDSYSYNKRRDNDFYDRKKGHFHEYVF